MLKRLYVGLATLFVLVGLVAFPAMSFASPHHDTVAKQNVTAAAWSGWREVPPRNGFTLDAPGATVYQGKSYLFVRGTDNRIYQIAAKAPGFSHGDESRAAVRQKTLDIGSTLC